MQKHTKLLLMAGAALIVQTQQAWAQDSSQNPAGSQGDDAGAAVNHPATRSADQPGDIVVTGIRESLESSQNIKRKSDFFVDAITAEDVGKFPSRNVADALQQIPGIAVETPGGQGANSGGEGQTITVRGLGPSFNTVLLNGRRVATDSGGRSFNFDMLPSDLLGGTEVYKSANVQEQEGAVGATIDMKTIRPFDLKKNLTLVASARAFYDGETKKATPDVFGLIGVKTDDNRLGFVLSATYSKRRDLSQYAWSNQWLKLPSFDPDGNRIISPTEQAYYDNAFSGGKGNGPLATYWIPEKYTNTYIENDRSRLGINGTVQAKPTDTLTLTLDGMYGRYKVTGDGVEKAYYANPNQLLPGNVADENGSLIRYVSNSNPEYLKENYNTDNTYWAYGGNLKWQPSEHFVSSLDAWRSVSKEVNAGNNEYFVVHGPNEVMTIDSTGGYDTPQGIDGAILNYDIFPGGVRPAGAPAVGTTFDRDSLSAYRSWYTNRDGSGSRNEITEIRWDNTLKYDDGWLREFRFGAYYGKSKYDNNNISTSDIGWSNYGAYGIPLPANLFSVDNHSNFLSTANTPGQSQFINFNSDTLINYLLSPEALALRDQLNGLPAGTSAASLLPRGYTPILQPQNGLSVSEKSWALYAEATLHEDFGSVPLTLVLGLRYAHTKEVASSVQQALLDLIAPPSTTLTPDQSVIATNQFDKLVSADLLPVRSTSDYGYFLPSINARLDLTNRLVLRGSVARTLTRPDLSSLSPQITYPDTPRPTGLTASGGNFGLQPYLAWNYDVGAEWYFRRASVISVAYYRKDISGFIVSENTPYAVTIANADNLNVGGVSGNTATFLLSHNVNLNSASVSGVELSIQSGFDFLPSILKHTGFTASITLPWTNYNFDPTKDNSQTVFPGLSNSYFVSAYYDDGRLQARVSWNRREKYFEGFVNQTEPRWTLGRSQFDARVSFDITRNIQIFADAYNFTNTPTKQVGRYDNQFLAYWVNGSRYDGGVRLKF